VVPAINSNPEHAQVIIHDLITLFVSSNDIDTTIRFSKTILAYSSRKRIIQTPLDCIGEEISKIDSNSFLILQVSSNVLLVGICSN